MATLVLRPCFSWSTLPKDVTTLLRGSGGRLVQLCCYRIECLDRVEFPLSPSLPTPHPRSQSRQHCTCKCAPTVPTPPPPTPHPPRPAPPTALVSSCHGKYISLPFSRDAPSHAQHGVLSTMKGGEFHAEARTQSDTSKTARERDRGGGGGWGRKHGGRGEVDGWCRGVAVGVGGEQLRVLHMTTPPHTQGLRLHKHHRVGVGRHRINKKTMKRTSKTHTAPKWRRQGQDEERHTA